MIYCALFAQRKRGDEEDSPQSTQITQKRIISNSFASLCNLRDLRINCLFGAQRRIQNQMFVLHLPASED